MNQSKRIRFILLYFVLGCLVGTGYMGVAGCGGSSGTSTTTSSSDGGAGASGGTGSALAVAEKISVVDAQDSSSSSLSQFSLADYAVADLPADSPYNTDPTFTFVNERSADALGIVQEILCYMDLTLYDHPSLINTGDYIAYIPSADCQTQEVKGSEQASQDNSSSSESIQREKWIVNSYRANDSSNHVVATWIHMPGGEYDPPMILHTRTEISEPKSDTNPYGIFIMNFEGFLASGDEIDPNFTDPVMKGFLKTEKDPSTGEILIKFWDEFSHGDEFGFSEKVTMTRSGDNVAGTTSTSETNSFDGTIAEQFTIAANGTAFLREDGDGNEVCLSQKDFTETTHRYGVYYGEDHAKAGQRVSLNGGFPVVKISDDGKEHHGFIGYHGLWMSTTVNNGDTLYKETFGGPESDSTRDEYTALIVKGKLKKHTKETATLSQLAGLPLNVSSCTFEGCSNYILEWDKDTETLWKTHEVNENWVRVDVEDTEYEFTNEDFAFYFWSPALGGNGQVEIRDESTGSLTALTNDSNVVFYKEEVVTSATNVPETFACFQNCPSPSDPSTPTSKSSYEAGENSYERVAQNVAPGSLVAGTHYEQYNFDGDSLTLQANGQDIITTEEGESGFGVWTEALVDVNDLADLACDWNPNSTCAYKARFGLDVYYSWETGPNDWNQLALLKDSNNDVVTFDPPMQLKLVRSNGTVHYIEYNGSGHLNLPGKCVSGDTGEDVDCGDFQDDRSIRWVPEFSIADGSSVTNTSTNDVYYIKGLDKEQIMKAKDASFCSDLSLTTYDLPDETLWEKPVIGDEPVVTDAPAVIDGVLQ